MIERVYGDLGLGQPTIRLATRPEKAIGSEEDWEHATELLGQSVTNAGKEFTLAPGEGAFYGPKLAFNFKDAIGRSSQLGTVRVDLGMPPPFGQIGRTSFRKRVGQYV